MRLIDAEKVEKEINKCVWDAYRSNEDEMGFAYFIANGIIENAPTIDAIPVEWIRKKADEMVGMPEVKMSLTLIGLINEWRKEE